MSYRISTQTFLALSIISAGLLASPHDVQAETTECQEIRRLPVVVNRGGVWCLKRDLSYPSKTGAAIEIRRNNVVLDLNGYKILGNAALDTQADGIRMDRRKHVRVTNGNIERFRVGVHAVGGFSNRFDHLTLDLNRHYGIFNPERPTNTIIEYNVVTRTGRSTRPIDTIPPLVSLSTGIYAGGDRTAPGIGARVSHNDVSIVNTISGSDTTLGILVFAERVVVDNNVVHGKAVVYGVFIELDASVT